jgi:hypothetical protein
MISDLSWGQGSGWASRVLLWKLHQPGIEWAAFLEMWRKEGVGQKGCWAGLVTGFCATVSATLPISGWF